MTFDWFFFFYLNDQKFKANNKVHHVLFCGVFLKHTVWILLLTGEFRDEPDGRTCSDCSPLLMNPPSLTAVINASSLIQPSPTLLFSLHLLCRSAMLFPFYLLFIALPHPNYVFTASAVMLPCLCPASLSPLFLQLFLFSIIVIICICFF